MKRKLAFIGLVYIPAGFVILSILLVVILKKGPVVYTPLMLKRAMTTLNDKNITVKYQWTPLEEISDDMIKAVLVAEDARFFTHNGFDMVELVKMERDHIRNGKPLRGCSTISQHTAKNCFTFCTDTYLRKCIEAYFTVLIEHFWGKKRILEVYLNVAEMGPGIYGAEAAARKYYRIHARDLTMADASTLACCLPNPLHRYPYWVVRCMAARRTEIATKAQYCSLPEKKEGGFN